MGKKLRCFQIDFDNPQAIYFPGQPVNGKVIVDLESETKVNGKNQTWNFDNLYERYTYFQLVLTNQGEVKTSRLKFK